MNLLVLNYEYPPIGNGGSIICGYLSKELACIGHSITVVTTWLEGLKEEETEKGVRIFRLKSKRKFAFQSTPAEMLSWIKKSKKFLSVLCAKEKFDLCVANFALPGGEVAIHLKRKFGIPYVVISHGHDIPWTKPNNLYFYHAIAYHRIKKICLRSEMNFVQSREMKRNIDNFTGKNYPEKNFIIPNGCDFKLFYPANPSDADKTGDIKHSTMNILFAGRLAAQKDPLTFLKSIRFLSEKNIPFNVKILGDGPLRKKSEHFVKNNHLQKQIRFLGKIPAWKMPEIYRESHVLVAPSLSEGMSLAVLEAIASGVYVLATPVSGNTELIKENINGEFVPVGKPVRIAEKIEKFYREKFSNGFSIAGESIADYEKKYSWRVISEIYDEKLLHISCNEL